jgi:hypothetical protein
MAGVRFLRELRRRHVFRVVAGEAVVGSLPIPIEDLRFKRLFGTERGGAQA